jgi:hypothetical protein
MQAGWKAILCLVRDFPNIRNLVEVGFQLNQLGVLPDQLVLREPCRAYLSDYCSALSTKGHGCPVAMHLSDAVVEAAGAQLYFYVK